MQVLFIILNREDYVDDVLAELLELEITGATVLEGVAMERVLAKDVPIFAGLLQTTRGSRSYNKNIIALIPDRSVVDQLVQILREMDIDFSDPAVGAMFTVPIDFVLPAPSPAA
ncbi:MAG: hypothetical protein RBU29_13610 [bacterium]|jgi:hypothetical protein|nr:hypothetical protein [bacterium]